MTANRWAIFNQFVDEIGRTLTPISRDIWMVIFRHANRSGIAHITRKRIAESLGVTEVHISRGIKHLKSAGLIVSNDGKYGYKMLTEQLPIGYSAVTNRLHLDSNESVTQQLPIGYPTVTNRLPGGNESVTHYRTLLQNISTEHITDKKKTRTRKKPKLNLTLFEEFWQAYPKKRGRGKAEESFGKINPNTELHAQIMTAVHEQAKSKDWTKDGGQFIPHPATWLNQKRWLDKIDEPKDGYGRTLPPRDPNETSIFE